MDKLKEIWRTVRRIHFWLICVTVLLLSMVIWFVAVGKIAKEKKTQASKYTGLFSTVQSIQGKERVPNNDVASDMGTLIGARTDEIGEAWATKFEQQNSDEIGILTWPEEKMGPAFVRHMEPLRPIEKELEFPLPESDDRRLRISWREDYREYIYEEMPRLAASIGAHWHSDGNSTGASAISGGYGEEGGYGESGPRSRTGTSDESLATQAVVHWDPANQQEFMATHFTWGEGSGGSSRSRGEVSNETGDPNVLEVLYAQEDLWTLRALMKIIQETNAGANTRFNAAIKTIHSLRIGKDAVESTGRILKVAAAPGEGEEDATGGAAGGYGGYGGYGEEGGYGGGYGGGGGAAGAQYYQSDAAAGAGDGGEGGYGGGYGGVEGGYGAPGGVAADDPAEGRYVDKNYQSLPAAKLRSVMAATEAMEPEDAYLAVAKRVPVRMRLSIDQRKLPDLLVACGNSELTVEVRQLRLNPEDIGSSSSSIIGRGGGYGGGYGDGPSIARGALATESTSPFPFDVVVELYGIVYIYNPVDDRALGVEVEAGDVSSIQPTETIQKISQRLQRARWQPFGWFNNRFTFDSTFTKQSRRLGAWRPLS